MKTPIHSQASASALGVDLGGRTHIPELDGFRGIAILLVLAMHLFGMPGGWVGVDMFFTLSGFLITRILLTTRGEPNYFRRFYTRRTLRIFPIYYLLIGLVFILSPDLRDRLWWYACYLADFTAFAPKMHIGRLTHTWSLAVEEQFYLVWPLLVFLLSPRRLRNICIIGLILANLFRLCANLMELPFFFVNSNILVRCDGLLVGSMIAQYLHDGGYPTGQNRRWAMGILASCAILSLWLMVTGRFSVTANANMPMQLMGMWGVAFGSGSLLWLGIGASRGGMLQKILTARWLRFMGRISYGLYLYHIPILFVVRMYVGERVHTLFWATVVSALTLGVACISWFAVEAPIISWKRFLDGRGRKQTFQPT
jgi:peptidoglycan/LPS O-acetylase OafA/YrhL